MSGARTSGLPGESAGRDVTPRGTPVGRYGLVSSVLYLARREVRRTWRSRLWSVILASVMGVGAAVLLAESFGSGASPDGSYAIVLGNLIFLLWAGVFPGLNTWEYPRGHLGFLRSLPLTVPWIVAARALVSVFSVLVLSAAFFSTLHLFSEPLRAQFGVGGYLLFAAFWAGCALAFEAVGLLTELVMSSLAGFLSYLLLITALGGLVGSRVDVVGAVVELVESYGPVAALASLLVGGAALAFSGMAGVRRLRWREAAG